MSAMTAAMAMGSTAHAANRFAYISDKGAPRSDWAAGINRPLSVHSSDYLAQNTPSYDRKLCPPATPAAAPFALTGNTDAHPATGRRFLSDKGAYRSDWAAGINRPLNVQK